MIEETIINTVKNEIELRYKREVHPKIEDSLDELGLDSLDKIELWLDLEDEFKIDVPEEETKKLKTIRDLVELVKKYER